MYNTSMPNQLSKRITKIMKKLQRGGDNEIQASLNIQSLDSVRKF